MYNKTALDLVKLVTLCITFLLHIIINITHICLHLFRACSNC